LHDDEFRAVNYKQHSGTTQSDSWKATEMPSLCRNACENQEEMKKRREIVIMAVGEAAFGDAPP